VSSTLFNASASMLGYVYQIRYALLLSLRRLSDVSDPDECNISIEKLDDVAFDRDGTPEELLQTKCHIVPGNLTDRSADIWKTIRIWIALYNSGEIALGNVILTLVTTQSLPLGSLACLLGIDKSRDTATAKSLMDTISFEKNDTNQQGYDAYKALTDTEKNILLDSIRVIGNSNNLLNIRDMMIPIARMSVPAVAANAFVGRLEGEWFKWCIEALTKTPTGIINLGDLQSLIDHLRPEYSLTNLPPEFSDAIPSVVDAENDNRVFVAQLKLFNAPPRMIQHAIINYYRAFEQRNKWHLDGLLNPGELGSYDRRLSEKWSEKFSYLEAQQALVAEENNNRFALELYQHCQENGVIPIRRDFIEAYLSKGSYHLLADRLDIGWHPEFGALLVASNEGAA
jgi:hypothetical protein